MTTDPTKQHLISEIKNLTEKEKYQAELLDKTRALIAGHLRVVELIEEDESTRNHNNPN
jgi:hypothetical protein